MPDITMCMGGECKLKETCYRYRAIPCESRQSFFSLVPCGDRLDYCEYFWQLDDFDRVRSMEEIENVRKR